MITRRDLLVSAGALAITGALAAKTGIAAWPKPPGNAEALLEFFDTIALRRPDNNGTLRPGWVRKWATAVSISSRGIGAVSHGKDLDNTIRRLSTLTGYPFHTLPAMRKGSGRIIVYYYSNNEMRRLYQNNGTLCMTRTDGRRGRLHFAQVRIGASHADCIDHEMMHAIGFDNHWLPEPHSSPIRSVLAARFGRDRDRTFSPWDEAAIRVLYDPRLRPWTKRDVALARAREIIREMYHPPGPITSGG